MDAPAQSTEDTTEPTRENREEKGERIRAEIGYLVFHGGVAYGPAGFATDLITEDEAAEHNRELAARERSLILSALPERIAAYVSGRTPLEGGGNYTREVSQFTGERLGTVTQYGSVHRTLGGARRVHIRVKIGGGEYVGYVTDTRSLVFLRRVKGGRG